MMKSKHSIYKLQFVLIGLVLMFGCEKRGLDELEEPSFSSSGEVFIDNFTGDLNYAAFGGSDVTAFDIETQETFNNSTRSMRFAVPDADSPSGAFAGGVFFSGGGRDLSGFNALTFYIKATQPATIGELGFGNDLGDNEYVTTITNFPVNTNWQKVIIPIPDASKLVGEKGLFYYAAGPQDGKGYTFYIDEVQFETLTNISEVTGLILDGQTQTIDNAETGDKINISGLQASVTLPNGTTQTVNTTSAYFTFTSSNPAVAGVDANGEVSVVDAGNTTISASLGGNEVTGSLELTSTGAPVAPTVAAPAPPTREASDVVSLYSNAYTNEMVDTWNPRWEFSTTEEFFIQVAGDDVIRYRNLNFVGVLTTTSPVNVSAMSTYHIDIWTPDPIVAGSEFKVLFRDFGADGVIGPLVAEGGDDSLHELVAANSSQLSSETWISLDIPMSDFTGLTSRGAIGQMVLSGNLPNLYLDNVYFYRAPVTPPTAAPTPTTPEDYVLSVYSDAYTDIAGTDFNPNWGQAGFDTAQEVMIDGNNTRHYPNFNYQGIQLGSPQDVSSYGFLHLDYYTTNSDALNVFLISPGPKEVAYSLPVPTSGWNSVDIPLSHFLSTSGIGPVDLTDVIQFKFDGGDASKDIFIDNIYFRPPVVPPVAAPVPTYPAGNVLSVYSDSYTDIAGTDFNPNWGQDGFAVAGELDRGGNFALSYPNHNYQGIQLGSAQDVSGYTYLHLDFYSANADMLSVYLISPGPMETPYSLDVPTLSGWNSIDIPLSHFSSVVDLSNVIQFKFDVFPGGTTGVDIYIDNILFRND